MDRWVSRSSSGRRTPARSRCFWSAISPRSSAIRGSSSRTASTSIGSSGTSFGGAPRCSPARSGRSTTCSATSPMRAQRRHAGRVGDPAHARRPARGRACRSSSDLSSSATTAGFADTLLQAIGELESGLVDAEHARRRSAGCSPRPTARSSTRSGSGIATVCAGTRSSGCAATSTPGRASRVFAYGFEDLTGAEWALLEALAARTDVTVSIPYEPGRAAFAALERTVDDLAGARGRRDRGAAACVGSAAARARSRISSASCSRTSRNQARRLDGAIRFLEGAGARGTVELLASELASLLRGGTLPERVAVVCESVERWRAPLETALSQLGVPYAIEHGRRLGDTPFGRALVSRPPVRLARRRARRSLRVPALAVLRARAPLGRLRRGPAARARGRRAGSRRRGERAPARRAGPGARRAPRARTTPVAAARGLVDVMVRNAWGLDAPPTATMPAATRVRIESPSARSTSCAALADGGVRGRRRGRRRRARADARPSGCSGERAASRARPRARADARVRRRLRARARGGSVPAARAAVAAPRRRRRRELGGRLERPDAVARDRYLFYTACTRPRSASCSCARRRGTRARRASRARSGRT